MNEEETKPGFKIDSWQSLFAAVSIIVFMASGLAWGLKLEAKIDQVNTKNDAFDAQIKIDVMDLQRQVEAGILPITRARIDLMEEQIRELRAGLITGRRVARD